MLKLDRSDHLMPPAQPCRVPGTQGWRTSLRRVALLALFAAAGTSTAQEQVSQTPPPVAAHGVIGVQPQHLDPSFWIGAQIEPQRELLDPAAIAAQNAKLQRIDASVHDLEALPATMSRRALRAWMKPLQQMPARTRYDEHGIEIPPSRLQAIAQNANYDDIARRTRLRYGLVTQRADLRSVPSTLRVFNSAEDHDIDRFQESALFPGTPVVVLHESRDRAWWFVVSPRYAAWIEQRHVALADAKTVFEYTRKVPAVVVTAATVHTVYTPEQPSLSRLQLDMGVRVPLLSDWPADQPVNGQHPYTAHVIELPQRDSEGRLQLLPALLPATADVQFGYLPLTPANVLRQAFKFLGERYGWGHSYDARDCSGFVSEVYRSFGMQLPRNSSDQAKSDAYERLSFAPDTSREQRLAVIHTLQVGDLVYIPGHVMMVIGQQGGQTWVIHDTTGITYLDAGELRRIKLNAVSVTPLDPLMSDAEHSTVERITSIQRLYPRPPSDLRTR